MSRLLRLLVATIALVTVATGYAFADPSGQTGHDRACNNPGKADEGHNEHCNTLSAADDGDGGENSGGHEPNEPAGPSDNCPDNFNPDQGDLDNDGTGDRCDQMPADGDNDTQPDAIDCDANPSFDPRDGDKDGRGNECDSDDDGDGIPDSRDNCAGDRNPAQQDRDRDGEGDACDSDADGNGENDSLEDVEANAEATLAQSWQTVVATWHDSVVPAWDQAEYESDRAAATGFSTAHQAIDEVEDLPR